VFLLISIELDVNVSASFKTQLHEKCQQNLTTRLKRTQIKIFQYLVGIDFKSAFLVIVVNFAGAKGTVFTTLNFL